MARISRSKFKTTGPVRRVTSRVTIEKGNVTGRASFVACVSVGRPGFRGGRAYTLPKPSGACAAGRNPRLALANALTKAGVALHHRGEHGRGAFAGRK